MKTGRRNLLKMLGVSPALLVPWTPATEQVVPPVPAPAEPEKLTFEEAMKRVDWSKTFGKASVYSATGGVSFGPAPGDATWDDGPGWEA